MKRFNVDSSWPFTDSDEVNSRILCQLVDFPVENNRDGNVKTLRQTIERLDILIDDSY
jgi:hypothetical protein